MEYAFSIKNKIMQDGILSKFQLDIFEDAYLRISLTS